MAEIIINGQVYKLTCSMRDCNNNLHSFHTNKTIQNKGIEKGCCCGCKSSFVDWERVYKKNILDIEYLESAFKLEMFRNVYWTIKQPTQDMINKYKSKSPKDLSQIVLKRLETTLSKPKNDNSWDGRQTPFTDDLLYWSQHATGTCCRKCLEQWYNIDANTSLSSSDYKYLEQVITYYITQKTQ